MIHYLLLFQFTLIYWFMIVLGLIVYGSDFASVTGKLYLLPMLFVPLIHRFYARFASRVSAPVPATVILLSGALLAWLAYQPLHFDYWDEHNSRQAALLSTLGVFSYLASVIASVRLQHWQGDHQRATIFAWLVLGLLWLPAVAYPMYPLLVLAIILAVASVWHVSVPLTSAVKAQAKPAMSGVLKYLLFLVVLDLGLIILDYQVDSRWAWYLGAAFIMAALGSWIAVTTRLRFYWPVVVITGINFIVAILWPAFVINPLHGVLIGLCLGWVTGRLLYGEAGPSPSVMLALAVPVVLGLTLGNLFYANLAYVTWRTLLLVPLLALLLRRPSTNQYIPPG